MEAPLPSHDNASRLRDPFSKCLKVGGLPSVVSLSIRPQVTQNKKK